MLRGFLVAISATCAFASAAIAAEWEVVGEWTDPFVGDEISAARVTNEEGFTFMLFRSEDGRVRALYSLPSSTFDRLPQKGRVLMIRPGEHDSKEIEAEIVPDGIVEKGRSDGIAVRDLMWHGQELSPTRGTLRNILDSDRLHARFFLDDGRTVDTSWSLDGANPVVAEALEIEVAVDQAERDWAEVVTNTFIAQAQRCSANGRDRSCINAMDACGDILTEDRDKPGFDACMASRGY